MFDMNEEELDPITGMPVPPPSNPELGAVAQMGPPKELVGPPAPPPEMNPAVKDYLMKKFDLGEFSDENRKKVLDDSRLTFGDKASSALAALGAGFSGGDAGAAGAARLQGLQGERNKGLEAFDRGRKDKIESYRLGKELTADQDALQTKAVERDPNSPQSKIAQQLAKEMGFKGDTAGITAEKFKAFSPALEKIYDIRMKSQDRRDAMADKKLIREEKGSEGQKAVDKDFAKDYNDWTATGKASLIKNLEALREARDALKKDPSLTGGLTGVLGDRLTADRVLKQRMKIGSAIQGALKATLGTAFTEQEGKRVLANAYNEAASADTNLESLDAQIKQLESQGRNNEEKAKHFEKNGSLKGYSAGAPPPSSSGKHVTKKQFSQSRNQTRIIYSDGTEEIIDGRG